MDKKVSIKSIDKIIKDNKFEKREIVYKCADETVVVEVNPCVNYGDWYEVIETSMGIIFGGDSEYIPALVSAAYGFALIACFTNLKTDNVSKVIEIAKSTDIIERIELILPASVLKNFRDDFTSSKSYKEAQIHPIGKIMKLIEPINGLMSGLDGMSEEDLQKIMNQINEEAETAE